MKPTATSSYKYPLGTIAAYGPDNQRATKLAVGVFKRPGRKDPDELHRWITQVGDVRDDPVISAEVVCFLKRHRVRETVTTELILGCPHEEGIDYPLGETCPHCPFWANIDRFTHEPKPVTRPPRVSRNDPCPCGSGKKYKKCCGANLRAD